MADPIRSELPPEDPLPSVSVALLHFAETARGIDALNGLRRLRNSQDQRKYPNMTEQQLSQRKTLLDIGIRVLEDELHKDLDVAAERWLRVRGRIK